MNLIMSIARRLVGSTLTAAALAATSHAQSTEYGHVYGYTSGGLVTQTYPNGSIDWTVVERASAEAADNHPFPGLAQAHYVDYHPAGGFYDVELDVPAGKIHTSIQAPPKLFIIHPGGTANRNGNANALVRFQDVITITAPTVGYEPWPILTLHGHLEGTLTPGAVASGGPSPVTATVDWRFGFAGTGVFDASPGSSSRTFSGSVSTGGPGASYDQDLTATATVQFAGPGSQVTVLVNGSLTTTAWNGGGADFQNTASFGLELPPGYTYTAAMGFATAVPEPAHGAIAALGLLGVAAWRRARRNGSAH
jgi:hypothetical protein